MATYTGFTTKRRLWSYKTNSEYLGKPEMATRGKQELDKVQLAYLAGIIDGEGHISISRQKSPHCKRGYVHRAVVSVSNTQLKLMNRLKSWFGGHIKIHKPRKFMQNKSVYEWNVWAVNEQMRILQNVIPYLFLKRTQAEGVLHFLLTRGKMGINKVSDEEFLRRENLCKRVQVMNHRGLEQPHRLSELAEDNMSSEAIVRPLEKENLRDLDNIISISPYSLESRSSPCY